MTLPIAFGLPPMEARPAAEPPTGPQWQYEPKWDGFRCLAFRDGAAVQLQSKAGKPLTRYFPEVVAAVTRLAARRLVMDGEIVAQAGESLSFDALLQRIHPAASRVARLARETPALYLVFDLLVDERGRNLLGQPLSERRAALERAAARLFPSDGRIRLSPATADLRAAQRQWLERAGLDGLIAKRIDAPYAPGERTAMVKVKRIRTADCVVGGFRYASREGVVGSLLLGLYDESDNLLHHVGFTSNIPAGQRRALTRKLERLRRPPGFTGRAPGGPSRWSTERSGEWAPLDPTLVVEVQYDHFSGGRFRHGTKFLRWRPDKSPRQCTFQQVSAEQRGAEALL